MGRRDGVSFYITLVAKETVGHVEKPCTSILLLRTVETIC